MEQLNLLARHPSWWFWLLIIIVGIYIILRLTESSSSNARNHPQLFDDSKPTKEYWTGKQEWYDNFDIQNKTKRKDN